MSIFDSKTSLGPYPLVGNPLTGVGPYPYDANLGPYPLIPEVLSGSITHLYVEGGGIPASGFTLTVSGGYGNYVFTPSGAYNGQGTWYCILIGTAYWNGTQWHIGAGTIGYLGTDVFYTTDPTGATGWQFVIGPTVTGTVTTPASGGLSGILLLTQTAILIGTDATLEVGNSGTFTNGVGKGTTFVVEALETESGHPAFGLNIEVPQGYAEPQQGDAFTYLTGGLTCIGPYPLR